MAVDGRAPRKKHCQKVGFMSYVIACGDEGVQINEGRRLAFVGAGFRLEGFSEAVKALKTLFGKKIAIASSEENAWVQKQLNLHEWDQVNASMEQHIEALADREKLLYAGHVTFTDPRVLAHGIKAHMVRPHGIHIANKICFTLGGGEQKFNLGCYVISADWVAEVGLRVARPLIESQIEFYKNLAKKDLMFVFEEGGELGEKVAQKNRKILEKMGIMETAPKQN
jgi:hypothetical protein